MNQTMKNSIGRMTIPERLEVLKELSLSTPEILDYLIKAHDKALIDERLVPETIKNGWTNVRESLKSTMENYFHGWKPL